jgi:hypothetical protein
MPNTFCTRSKLGAYLLRLFQLARGCSDVQVFEAGKLKRRYYVAWA